MMATDMERLRKPRSKPDADIMWPLVYWPMIWVGIVYVATRVMWLLGFG